MTGLYHKIIHIINLKGTCRQSKPLGLPTLMLSFLHIKANIECAATVNTNKGTQKVVALTAREVSVFRDNTPHQHFLHKTC